MKREEIQRAVGSREWQTFRRSLLGLSMNDKLRLLRDYAATHKTRVGQIQVQNYINALKRAGLLK